MNNEITTLQQCHKKLNAPFVSYKTTPKMLEDIGEHLKVYGIPHPYVDAMPKFRRSMFLESYKRHISHFMPNQLICWDVQSNRENPTRSIKLNSLINKTKKGEVQRRGKNQSLEDHI